MSAGLVASVIFRFLTSATVKLPGLYNVSFISFVDGVGGIINADRKTYQV